MGHWEYTNLGASGKPEHLRHIAKLFDYLGFTEEASYEGGDGEIYPRPKIDRCVYNYRGENVVPFFAFDAIEVCDLLNALFPGTSVYVHYSEGHTSVDYYKYENDTFNADDMTYYHDEWYKDVSVEGTTGYYRYKERFAYHTPELEYVQKLIDLCTEDGNSELAALLLELSNKIRNGLPVFEDNPEDSREVGAKYDVED